MMVDLEAFVEELETYEFGVKYIIPTEYRSDNVDSALSDELDNILDARTYLEKQVRLYPELAQQSDYLSRLQVSDNLLRSKREIILSMVPDFARGRTRLRDRYPETYWWWYLEQPMPTEAEEQIVYVSKEHLGLSLAESIMARASLQVGQLIKITVPDTKHFLISIG